MLSAAWLPTERVRCRTVGAQLHWCAGSSKKTKNVSMFIFSAFFSGGDQPVLMKRHEAISVFRKLAGWKGSDFSFPAVVGVFFESLKERFPLVSAAG